MEQHDINELHKLLENFALEKGYSHSNIMAFLSVTFLGTMAMRGYSQEFFDKTCENMKNSYFKYIKKMENLNNTP